MRLEDDDVVLPAVTLDEGDPPVGRDAQRLELMRRFVARSAEGRFENVAPVRGADGGEVVCVGHPVGADHLVRDFARRPAGERHARQGAESGEPIGMEQQRNLGRLRDRHHVRVMHPQRPRLGAASVADEDVARPSVPRRAIDDGVAVWREPRAAHFAAAERQPLEVDFGDAGCRARREVPAGERGAGDRDEGEEDEEYRRDAALRLHERPRDGRCALRRRGMRRRRLRRNAHRRRLRIGARRGTRQRSAEGSGARDGRQCLEVEREVACRLEAEVAFFLEAAPHEPLECGLDGGQFLGELGRVFFEDGAQRLDGGVAFERALAGEDLVEDDAEGEDVGAGVERFAAYLFGRHVADGAEDQAGLGGGAFEGAFRRVRGQFRDAEVEDLGAAVAREKDVLGLEVTVDDAFVMRRGEPLRDLQRGVDGAARRERAAREPVAQGLALKELADDVRPAAVMPDVVDRQEVRMVEHPGGARFLLEPLQLLLVAGGEVGQYFDRDVAPEARVFRTIDHAHAAFADDAGNAVRPEHRVWGEDHGLGG